MRIILILMIFLTFESIAVDLDKLQGTWAGHQKNGHEYFHHILEIDNKGKGFYAISIGDSYLEGWIFPVDLSGKKLVDGHVTLNLRSVNPNVNTNQVLILSPHGMYKELGVLTINLLEDGSPFHSLGWSLVKTEANLGTNGLYKFAKSAL
ncbi:hypothetical protein ACFSJY_10210 [Thalassotalea euphylliae]|uniref:hypothetical protein n=1 Tax=Thalassotalea euphylliae TaxID=1655234 RepID=UPI003642DC5B